MSESFEVSQGELTRRRFLQSAALTGAAVVVPAAVEGQATNPRGTGNMDETKLPNPIVPRQLALTHFKTLRHHLS